MPGVSVGPGDDAAWLGGLALSVDTVVEGVHFRFDWSSPQDVGWKAMAAALSDLAASRARPKAALLSLSLPAEQLVTGARSDQLMEGAHEASAAYGCPIIGGDVVHAPSGTQISVTVIGQGLSAPLLRRGAAAGDLVQVSGPLGWAALAVQELSAGRTPPARALRAHRRPVPRFDLLDSLARATAAIDISDGLLADAARVAVASGVTLALDRQACVADGPGRDALCLSGGEDYELLACAPAALPGFRVIGRAVAGAGELVWTDGTAVSEARRGWDHGERS